MQRWCSKLRSFAALRSSAHTNSYFPSPSYSHSRFLHTSPNLIHKHAAFPAITSVLKPLSNAPSTPSPSNLSSHLPPFFVQVRYITAKQRKRKLKSRKPMTPVTSKVKKIKIKCYSSFKGRFRIMNDGQIRRWKEGKRHNAHLKSKNAKRRLRRPDVVPLAYAKVMKKLNFCG